jgi:hypothetical protein
MSSKATLYRRTHPEVYQKIVETQRVTSREKYRNDPEYKEKTRQNALNRYYRLKEQKQKQIEQESNELTQTIQSN